jgi:hypothetical protein
VKIMHKKMLSFLLVFAMLVTLFPVAALSASSAAGTVSGAVYDKAIASFAPITLAAGTVSATIYADDAAVIAALSAQFPSVTALTADGGEVPVPVNGWEDTDTYDPATAGSYTFTATLGDIPAGYANPANLTATAEVVVAGNGTQSGVYSVPLSFYKATGNDAIGKDNSLINAGAVIQINSRALVKAGADGYTVTLQYNSQSVYDYIQIIDSAKISVVTSAYRNFKKMPAGDFNVPQYLLE